MKLTGLTIAILVADGFEQSEMVKPRQALDEADAVTRLISPNIKMVKAWTHDNWGKEFSVDVHLEKANPDDYDALLLPGGVMNPDHLRMLDDAIIFIKAFVDAKKPIAAICHGPWTLINAGGVDDRTMTSWPSIRIDLENAGAHWVDKDVVRDGNLVTSRKPDDIPAFNKEMIALFAESVS